MTILTAIGEELSSNKILEVGYDLATTYDEQLLVLHVIPKKEFNSHKSAVKDSPGAENFTIDREAQNAAEIARKVVHESLDEYDFDRIGPRGSVSDPTEKILSEVDRSDPQFPVIGGKQRSPVGKAIFGSTAQSILLNAPCPVVLASKE